MIPAKPRKISDISRHRPSGITLLIALSLACSVDGFGSVQASTADIVQPDATKVTSTIVANIKVDYLPMCGVVSPDNSTLYVASGYYTSGYANTVSVIDTATNTVTTTIPIGSLPNGIAITPDGSTLYVSSAGGIVVIATSTNTVTTTISLGTVGLTVSPDGKSVWAVNSKGVEIINVANNEVSGTVAYTYPAQPLQVLFDPTGAYAWVFSIAAYTRTEVALGGILQVDTKSLATERFVWGKFRNPGYAAITPNGTTIYEGTGATTTGLVIESFDTVTKKTTGTFRSTYEGSMNSMPAVTPDGSYVYFPALKNILVINTATEGIGGITIPLPESTFFTIAPNGSLAYAGNQFGDPNRHGAVLAIDVSAGTNAR
jgi:YVTN family beta-propeller protein